MPYKLGVLDSTQFYISDCWQKRSIKATSLGKHIVSKRLSSDINHVAQPEPIVPF